MYLAWSPEGARILFSAYVDYKPRLFLTDVAAGSTRQLDGLPQTANNPGWSPDGRILFTSVVGDQRELFAMAPETGATTRLSHTPASEADAAWSSDGRWVAYTTVVDGVRGLWVADGRDGANARLVASRAGLGFHVPRWSPDGRRLTFYSEAGDHKDQIWVVDADGSHLRRITDGAFHNTFPSWSADGRRLIFTTETGPSETRSGVLLSTAPDGSDRRLLAQGSVFLGAWAPDGRRLALTRFDEDPATAFKTELIVIDADGGDRRVIHH